MSKILIIIDMQNDFVYGALGTPEARAIVPEVRKKIERRCNDGWAVFFTQDTHFTDYLETQEGQRLSTPHCVFNTEGWHIIGDILTPCLLKSEVVCSSKYSFGYDLWQDRLEKMRGFPFFEIEIVGVCTDICVISNALILKSIYPDSIITVDSSCCAGTTPELHKMALKVMQSCQIEVINAEE